MNKFEILKELEWNIIELRTTSLPKYERVRIENIRKLLEKLEERHEQR